MCEWCFVIMVLFFFSSRRRHTRCGRDWSSDVCSSDLQGRQLPAIKPAGLVGRRLVHRFGDGESGMRIGPIMKQDASCNGAGICVINVGASDHTPQRNTRRMPVQRRFCLETLLVECWDHLTSFAWIARILPMASVDQKAVEKDWNARGFSCDLWTDAPGRVWRDFIHETDELVMLVEGEEEFEMNGQIHRLEIGQELGIPAGTYIPRAMLAEALRNGCTDTSGDNSGLRDYGCYMGCLKGNLWGKEIGSDFRC